MICVKLPPLGSLGANLALYVKNFSLVNSNYIIVKYAFVCVDLILEIRRNGRNVLAENVESMSVLRKGLTECIMARHIYSATSEGEIDHEFRFARCFGIRYQGLND